MICAVPAQIQTARLTITTQRYYRLSRSFPSVFGLRGIPLSQTSPGFYVVQATSAKFGLLPGNNTASTQNDE
jgi:hypothetical protein